FEGFGDELDELDEPLDSHIHLTDLPPSPILTQSDSQTHHGTPPPSPPSDPQAKESHSYPKSEYWDEDEFEGLPVEFHQESPEITESVTVVKNKEDEFVAKTQFVADPKSLVSVYGIEIACVSFLIVFGINYFSGKKENENLALAWAAKFATKDTIFEKNFSLLGVGEGEDSPLLLKEGQNVFKFYASGRRYCQGLLATLELRSRHDLISRVYNAVVPTKDEITFEVYMNDEAMDQLVFAVARKKAAKTMLKELPDLQRFASLMPTPSNKKWLSEDLSVVSESKEVAGDLITEVVLDQVLGEKAFEKLGKYFISMHFSDQHSGVHKKKLMFKFALPDHKNMADMTRLVALVPYYIDLVGRYKLSSQARSKTDAARVKAAQEAYKELQNARQENLQRKKADRRKMMEEAEAKLSAEAIRKKEAKERSRQMKKAGPKMKMTRAH
uniref:Coiled-coil domain-containing protein 47 n=2 Tax=Chenopodium quinoa TaxID=63459 RepID=A0A803N4Y4_CHEQI